MADLDDDIYRSTITALFENFRCALLALLPMADRAKINFRDEETHRDWERLAQNIFDVFVGAPIDADRAATSRDLPLARYDLDLSDYLGVSWITASPQAPHNAAVVRLLSKDAPFDTVQVVDVNEVSLLAGSRTTLHINTLSLALYRRSETGESTVVAEIEAND